MSQPESNASEQSKMKKLLNGGSSSESPLSRLPRGTASNQQVASRSKPSSNPAPPVVVRNRSNAASGTGFRGFKFLPAFWTIASIMSFTVNIVLLIVLLILVQNLNTVGVTTLGISDHLLRGLYVNFVKMDQAHIRTTIPVSQEIPVQFTLNVSGPTNVTLSDDVTITGALVTVNTGGLNINRARANIVLPQGTVLPILIDNLVVPVDQRVLAELNVDVDIPLNETELHEPFVGLREVVEPFYCLIETCP